MSKSIIRLTLGVGVLIAVLLRVPAQDQAPPVKAEPPRKAEPKKENYREFFKVPETTDDFWHALQFELEVGRYELAAKLLHGLVTHNPTDEDLLQIAEKDGMPAFLRLRIVPKWSDDPKIHAQAIKDADILSDRVGKAMEKILGDQKRIAKLIQNLTGDNEEKSFAARELYRSRALAIPLLIAQLRTADGEERAAILELLPRLAPETVSPLTAALAIPDDRLRLDLIDVLLKRDAKEAVPALWYLVGSSHTLEVVRKAHATPCPCCWGNLRPFCPCPRPP